jgi:hypothetical protein
VLYTSLDTGWIVKTGQYILANGVPQADMFSWSNPGTPFVAYQWLFEVAAAQLFNAGSLWLVGFAACILVGLLIFFFMPVIWLKKGVPFFLPFVFLALAQTPNWFNARPQLCSYFLILAFVTIMERYRSLGGKTKWLFALPPAMVLWANLHSFWFIGDLIVLAYLLGDLLRLSPRSQPGSKPAQKRPAPLALITAFVFCLLAVFINPYGPELVAYNWSFINGSHYMKIWELLPSFGSADVLCTILYIPIAWAVMIARRDKLPLEGFALFAIATAAAMAMRRFEPVAVVISWPYLGTALASINWSRLAKPIPAGAMLVAGQLLAAVAISVTTWYSQFPSLMSAWMAYTENSLPLLFMVKQHLAAEDRLFNDPAIGSFLIASGPSPVFVDSRLDMYPKSFVATMNDCLEAKPGWSELLHKWRINHVLVKDNVGLNVAMLSSPEWLLVLDDGSLTWWMHNNLASRDKLREWDLTDNKLRNGSVPKWIADATIDSRSAKYLVLSRLYIQRHQLSRAITAVKHGLWLMPDSKALHVELDNCVRLAGADVQPL